MLLKKSQGDGKEQEDQAAGGGGVELSINLLNCFKILYNTLTDGVFAISSMYA